MTGHCGTSLKVAVIGTGAAAFGVLDGLRTASTMPEITLIGPLRRRTGPFARAETPDSWPDKSWRSFYSYLKTEYGHSLIAPKTSFGAQPPKEDVADWGQVWRADAMGGLTEVWGLSCIPYDQQDVQGWPIGLQDLDPHYEAISESVGIAPTVSRAKGHARYCNRPPVQSLPLAEKLVQIWNSESFRAETSSYACDGYPATLAVETRRGHANACTGCGECMIGCSRSAMFNSASRIEEWIEDGVVARAVDSVVTAVDFAGGRVFCADGSLADESFDAIFVCAGTFGSAEIALRSELGLDHVEVVDSAAWTFPIFGPRTKTVKKQPHIALTSAVAILSPKFHGAGAKAQVQVYPVFEHLWRHLLIPRLWPLMRTAASPLRERLLIGRLFADESASQRYRMSLDSKGTSKLSLSRPAKHVSEQRNLQIATKKMFQKAGYKAYLGRTVSHKTSSHYLGGLPLGGPLVDARGKVGDKVHFCDALTFPSAPATSPTFTIMANARRVATTWLQSGS